MHALFDTGEWYEAQGDPDKAERYYRRAIDFSRRQQNGEELEGKALEALGRVHLFRGDSAGAIDWLTQAYRVYLSKQLHLHVPAVLVHMARALAGQGDAAGAARNLDEAVQLARARDHAASTALALIERGRLATATGALAGARADFDNALTVATRVGLLPLVPAAMAGQARVSEVTGDLDGAVASFERAAEAVDRIRVHVVSIELRSSFAAATHEIYSGLVRVLAELHRQSPGRGYDRRALLALERERSQALEFDAGVTAQLSPGAGAPDARIAKIQSALFNPDLGEARRSLLLEELDDAERNLQLTAPETQAVATRRTSIEQLQSALAPDEVLLEYAVDDMRTTAFVVTRWSLHLVPLDLDRDLAARVAFFVRALEANGGNAAIGAGRRLTQQLLERLPVDLATARRLLIVAAGPLARLPFAALPVESQSGNIEPLLAHHDVSYLPSLTLFGQRRATVQGPLRRHVLAVGDAEPPNSQRRTLRPLPASRVEAAFVARDQPSTLLIGDKATEHAIKQAGTGFDIWHLATHAVLDPDVPERSAVILSESGQDDGLLQAREIYQLPLAGSLVVLSGCRTADGHISGAEGLLSLSRAFLFAGGRTVIGALWDVPDTATAALVRSFYSGLDAGQDVGASLAEAQRAVAGRRPYESSSTWASLVVTGDPLVSLAPRERPEGLTALTGVVAGLLGLAGAVLTARRRS